MLCCDKGWCVEMRFVELSYVGRREVEGLFIPETRELRCLLEDAKEVAQDADSLLRNDESEIFVRIEDSGRFQRTF